MPQWEQQPCNLHHENFLAAFSIAAPSTTIPPHRCPLREALHFIADCWACVSPEQKRELLASKQCCLRCRKCNHFTRDCWTSRPLIWLRWGDWCLSVLSGLQCISPSYSAGSTQYLSRGQKGQMLAPLSSLREGLLRQPCASSNLLQSLCRLLTYGQVVA